MDVIGHVGVEVNESASRVVESHFPESLFIPRVEDVTKQVVQSWAGKLSQASIVILGAGPPCQGVSGLNADRLGALKDARSSLFNHVKRIELEVKVCFPWCAVYTLMESVASMDDTDLEAMSSSFGSYPWRIDAGGMLWCSRPRVYWLEWELFMEDGATMVKNNDNGAGEILLEAKQPLEAVCREGWTKLVVDRPFPTFTTSRPRAMPGRKPAGVGQCRDHEIERWVNDNYRFPPYQYCDRHCLVNKSGELRLPDIQEKEIMLGFPLNYTSGCMGKSSRKGSGYVDLRHTLIGNTWAVPVVAWLIGQLLWPLGICKKWTTQDLVDHLSPHMCDYLQTRLLRLPLRPLRGASNTTGAQELVNKLGNLVSVKGEDILLVNKTSEQAKYHRLRASVPSKLWVWKIIAGWQWKGQQEHINVLEMRAILASLQWKLHHKQLQRSRFIHLTDSMVCLHSLSRGRSSSRKLRRTLCRINALLLVSGCQGLWGYVHTDSNPADRPSRWGRRVKTKFRNG